MPLRRPVINSGVPGWSGDKYEQTVAKLPSLGTSLLHEHASAVISAMGVAFEDLQRHKELSSADEIESALMTLWAISREMRLRV